MTGRQRLLLIVLSTVLLTTGCRSYGEHYPIALMHEELQAAVAQSAEDLARRQVQLAQLTEASQAQLSLTPLATRYAALVQAHEAVLGEMRAIEAELAGVDNYRPMKRGFLAVVQLQRTLDRHYESLLRNAVTPPDTGMVDRRLYTYRSRYWIAPPFYQRLAPAHQDVTIEEAMRSNALTPIEPLPPGEQDVVEPPNVNQPGAGLEPEEDTEESAPGQD